MSPRKKKAKTEAASADLDEKCVNAIRVLSAEQPQAANSGHPGAPMGCAGMAYVLYSRVMNYSPANPAYFNRDRFILSNGHGCALLYSMLHLTGYDKPTMDDLKKFRKLHSITAGHPENFLIDAVEVSTGPLGQGISNAVGFAIAESHLAATFNKPDCKVIDNYTYAICGDGCLQEGVSAEASSLAGHLKLGKLTVLYDDNNITIDGNTSLSFTEDVKMRYESYGWQVLEVPDGDSNFDAIEAAIKTAHECTDKPTLIKVKTIIGFGSKAQGTHGVHGAPLGNDDIAELKKKFGFDPEKSFSVPDDVAAHLGNQKVIGSEKEAEWNTTMATYKTKYPKEAAELQRRINGDFPVDWTKVLPSWSAADKANASRNSSGEVLNALANIMPELMGGSADLSPSNKTELKCTHDYQAATPDGRYLRFGVREHGMSAICNGLAAYGGFIPFCATFLNFAGYALGAIRLSALSKFRVLYIMTHDSIGLGEDGPTHQPVGMLLSLRSIPNMYVFRPADSNEVAGSYKCAMEMKNSPSLFALSRQNLPNQPGSSIEKVAKGAYTLVEAASPAVILVGTGSEVAICVDAAKILSAAGVAAAVVSMPCWKLFDAQPFEYKASVFPAGVPVISVEAASVEGWAKYSHYQIGMSTFGKSGPYLEVYEYFGITEDAVAKKAQGVIKHFSGKPVTHLVDVPSF